MPESEDPETLDPAQFKPGSFGCHEVLHMASVCADLVNDRLCEHPAILAHPKWTHLADRAASALYQLYQAIGEEHL